MLGDWIHRAILIMEIFTEQAVRTQLAALILADPLYILLSSLAIWSIAILHHTVMHSFNGSSSSTTSPAEVAAQPGAKESRPKFKQGEKWHLTMNLRKPEKSMWLEVDDQYLRDHRVRCELLDNNKSAVLQCRPGSEAACIEVLEMVVQELTTNFPEKYRARPSTSNVETVEMLATGEVFAVRAPFRSMDPLEIAVRLAVEDLNILIKGGQDEHTL